MHKQVLGFDKDFVINALVVWFAAAKRNSLMSGKSHIEINRCWPGDGDLGRSDGAFENGYSDPVRPAPSVHHHPVQRGRVFGRGKYAARSPGGKVPWNWRRWWRGWRNSNARSYGALC